MSTPIRATPSRRPRAALTREVIVDAAVAVLDQKGLNGLTMRAVADRLGAGAMSLYRHVASRNELLDLVVVRLTAGATGARRTGDWRADLTTLALDTRAILLRRPNLTVLLTSRASSPAAGLASLDHALAILRDAGFSPHEAAFANHALGNYTAGAALWEAVGLEGAAGQSRRDRVADAGRALALVRQEVAPNVAWAAGDLFEGTADDRFLFGLGLLLDGLEARLATASTGRRPDG